MFNYDRAIYKTIDDEIQRCLIIRVVYIKQLMMKYNLFNYDSVIYKTIDNEIQLCLIMIELYIKQLMMKYNYAKLA